MKRWFSAALSLMLLFSLSASAETAAATGFKLYEETSGAYATAYPERWMMLDKATIEKTLADIVSGKADSGGLNPEAIAQYQPFIEAQPMAIFLDLYLGDNYNITYNDDPFYADYQTKDLVEQLTPLLEAQNRQIYQEFETLVAGELVRFGENDYFHAAIVYKNNGSLRQSDQFYLLKGARMLIFTFTLWQENGALSAWNQEMMAEVLTRFNPL